MYSSLFLPPEGAPSMHRANTEMESSALYSGPGVGTGVFYQAMPAVGADGRNIMKLIPVQKVNGQFVQSQTGNPKADGVQPQRPKASTNSSSSSPRPIQIVNTMSLNPKVNSIQPQRPKITTNPSQPIQIVNTVTLNPLANGQFMKRQMPSSPRHFNGNCVTANSSGPQNLTNLVTQVRGSLPRLPRRQSAFGPGPVTVNPPALTNGQYRRVPSDAHAKTSALSELQSALQKKMVAPSVGPTTSSTSPSVLFPSPVQTRAPTSPSVLFSSPVQTVHHGTPALSTASAFTSSIKSPSRSADQTSRRPSSAGSSPASRPSVSAANSPRPKSPIKWVIEEGDGSLAPCLVPVNSPVSESRAVAARGSSTPKSLNAALETALTPTRAPASSRSPPKSGPRKDNALMMCNGKVYPLAKRGNILPAFPPAAKPCAGGGIQPLQLGNVTGGGTPASQNSNRIQIRIPRRTEEIIDLCDDEPQGSTAPPPAPSLGVRPHVTQTEEDNVIFVSYIPPGSAPGPEKNTNDNNNTPTRKESPLQQQQQHPAKGPERGDGAGRPNKGPVRNMVIGWDSATVSVNEGGALADDPRNVIFVCYNPPSALSEGNRIDSAPTSTVTPTPDPVKGPIQHGTRTMDTVPVVGRDIATVLTNKTCRNSPAVDNRRTAEEAQQRLTHRPSENISTPSSTENIRHGAAQPSGRAAEAHIVISDVRNVPPHAGEEVRGNRQILAAGHGRDSNALAAAAASKPRAAETSGPHAERNLKGTTSQTARNANAHPINVEWMELMENIQHEDSISDGVKQEHGAHGAEKSRSCDRLLRKLFGITLDIRICLEKVDAVQTMSRRIPAAARGVALCVPVQPVHESMSELRDRQHWMLQVPKQRGGATAGSDTPTSRGRGLAAPHLTGLLLHGPTPPTHPNADPRRTAPLPLPLAAGACPVRADPKTSPKDTPCSDADLEHMFGPLDEEEDLGTVHGGVRHKPCCAEASAKPKRKGKPKMCTACPCGMPVATLGKKTLAKLKKLEQGGGGGGGGVTPEPGKVRRKRGRPKKSSTAGREGTPAKVPRKTEPTTTLGRTVLEGSQQGHTTEHGPDARGGCGGGILPAATPAESETNEKLMQERIERLKDLLREKEAALERYRKNLG